MTESRDYMRAAGGEITLSFNDRSRSHLTRI